ncbi:MAG TPA: tetratricopeptide repeat protein [Roseiflexaceae bacterium]|nr:tetratricopeptide repeat protein [Roseiflexaceae bacterium]
MTEGNEPEIAAWRQGLAYWWYAWGLSWCYWGVRMSSQSFFRAGIRSFSRTLRLWPAFAPGYYRRGLIRGRELNQHAAAIEDLSRAIELDPQWPEPYLQRGLFQRFHGDSRAALADLQRYVELSDDPFWRGEAERQIGMIHGELSEGALEG